MMTRHTFIHRRDTTGAVHRPIFRTLTLGTDKTIRPTLLKEILPTRSIGAKFLCFAKKHGAGLRNFGLGVRDRPGLRASGALSALAASVTDPPS